MRPIATIVARSVVRVFVCNTVYLAHGRAAQKPMKLQEIQPERSHFGLMRVSIELWFSRDKYAVKISVGIPCGQNFNLMKHLSLTISF